MADYEMFAGDDFILDEYVVDAFGAPQDIAGFQMWFTAKFSLAYPDQMAVARLDNGALGGILFVAPTKQGRARITMPKLATRWEYTGDVVLVFSVKTRDPQGIETTVETGTITVHPNATRAV